MKERISVLIIEDHPLITEGYKNALTKVFAEDHDLVMEAASDCDSALEHLVKAANSQPFDMLLIDLRLPPSSDGIINSGEDLAFRAKHWLPEAKIVILTSHSENVRIQRIIKKINPDGLLIKGDITSDGLTTAIKTIYNNETYYSQTVNAYLRKRIQRDFLLDDTNLKILSCLSQGVKTKNLTNHVNLSLSAIEKRKNHIKELLGIEKGDNEELLKVAREQGFI